MYNVVFRNKSGNYAGVITWSCFESKADFDKWFDARMQDWYDIASQGCTETEAVDMCATPTAQLAALNATLKEVDSILKGVQDNG